MALRLTCDFGSPVSSSFSDETLSEKRRDCYEDCKRRNIWGSLKILLLDTTFFSKLSKKPEDYNARFRAKVNLLEYDFVVMPMFGA